MRQSYGYMPPKLKYEVVKEIFEKEGYTLVSKEYLGNGIKVKTLCPEGHEYWANVSSFKNDGDRCSECAGVKRHDFNYVKSIIESRGYTLISTQYESGKKELKTICPNGHPYMLSFSRFFHKGNGCAICSGRDKYTFEEVKKIFVDRGYTLLSTEYKNMAGVLETICPNGHDYKTKFNNFVAGSGCPECVGLRKYTLEEIQEIVRKRGETLLSKEYTNNKQKLEILCKNNKHIYTIKLNSLLTVGTGCKYCSGNYKKDIEEVKQLFLNKGYILLSKIYKDNKEKLDLICPKGHECQIRLHDFLSEKSGCSTCWLETHSWMEAELLEWIKTIAPDAQKIRMPNKTPNKKSRPIEIDVFIPSLNIGIEYNGLYWHNTKNKHKDHAIIKLNKCSDLNIRLVTIFEDEWIYDKENTKNKLKCILMGNEKNRINNLINEAKEQDIMELELISDNRWENPKIYKEMGFILLEDIPSIGYYVKNQKRLSMDKYLNLHTIFDCGYKRWKIILQS